MKTKRTTLLGLAGQLLLLATLPFQAAAAEQTTELDTITVTANKMEENIEDIPQSVSVIDAATIENKGIQNISDVVKEIPNLSSSFLYSEDINFRGINSSILTNNNPVVLYIDGIPQSNRFAYDASLVNVERVEVLRGPQGTLYGKDAIGGVINVITKTPTNVCEGSVGIEYGSNNAMLGTLAANGPVVKDILFFGLNGRFAQDDGWVTNHYPGMDEDANGTSENTFGLNLLYTPTDRLSVRLILNSDYQKNDWVGGMLIPYGADPNSYSREDAEDVEFDQPTFTRTQSNAQALNIKYTFDAVILESVTTNKRVDIEADYDLDYGNDPLYADLIQFQYSTIDTRSQELRLSSKDKGGIRWVGGLYYENDVYTNDRYGAQYPGMFTGTPFDVDMDDVSETTSNTMAVFGQVMMPFADRWELTLGGRYQSIDKEIDSDFYYLPIGMSGPPYNSYHGDHTWTIFLPKAALSYHLGDNTTVYASVSAGYLPGGFNHWAQQGGEEENRFDPQTSVDYEIGIKSTMNRLYIAANLFYMDIKDIHVYEYDLTGMMRTSNAAGAHSLGAELEFTYLLTDRWDLSGALGLVQAEYDEYSDAVSDGNTIEKTPAYTARLGIQYTDPQGLYARCDLRSQGRTYYNAANSVNGESYYTADAKIGYKLDRWDMYTFVKNITDESYIAGVSEVGVGNVVSFGDPRTFGVGLRYTF